MRKCTGKNASGSGNQTAIPLMNKEQYRALKKKKKKKVDGYIFNTGCQGPKAKSQKNV